MGINLQNENLRVFVQYAKSMTSAFPCIENESRRMLLGLQMKLSNLQDKNQDYTRKSN